MRFFPLSVLLILLLIVIPLVQGEIMVIVPESMKDTEDKESSVVIADFNGAPSSGRAPLMVQFIDLSKGKPVSWSWDFGDTYTSRNENPVHTYSRGGVYSVRLMVSGEDGSSDTVMKEGYITARPVPLVANFSAEPGFGYAPLDVQFRDRSTDAMVWLWNFGDGTAESMQPDPFHTFTKPGTYPVKLTVSNTLGETAVHEENIEVLNPDNITAEFNGSPRSGPMPLTVRFQDRSGGKIVSWLWDFGDGSRGTERNPAHTYKKEGSYQVSLTVSSAERSSDSEEKPDYVRVTGKPVSGSIPLSSGWNFVSVPGLLNQGNDTAVIFRNVEANGHSLFRFDPGNGGWSALKDSDRILPLEGFWIFSARNDTVPLSLDPGSGLVPPRNLLKGWNTIGITGVNSSPAKQAFSPVEETWVHCIGFNSSIQRYGGMISKGVNDNVTVDPSQGYWIFLSDNSTFRSTNNLT
jgi:PKD repeat protein